MMSDNRVEIYDTTLRDGTQAEGVSLSLEDKLLIAERLDALGVDYIEGGYPLSNPKDAAFFRDIRSRGPARAKIASFGMTRRRGIAWTCTSSAGWPTTPAWSTRPSTPSARCGPWPAGGATTTCWRCSAARRSARRASAWATWSWRSCWRVGGRVRRAGAKRDPRCASPATHLLCGIAIYRYGALTSRHFFPKAPPFFGCF